MLACLDRRRHLRCRVGLDRLRLVAIGDADRVAGRMRTPGRHGDQFDALHQHALGHQVGAHFARADDADAHRPALVGAAGEVAGEAGQSDVGGHGELSARASSFVWQAGAELSSFAASSRPTRVSCPRGGYNLPASGFSNRATIRARFVSLVARKSRREALRSSHSVSFEGNSISSGAKSCET